MTFKSIKTLYSIGVIGGASILAVTLLYVNNRYKGKGNLAEEEKQPITTRVAKVESPPKLSM